MIALHPHELVSEIDLRWIGSVLFHTVFVPCPFPTVYLLSIVLSPLLALPFRMLFVVELRTSELLVVDEF